MQDGTLDFSRGEFFSGMTDEALQRQAMLTWNLAPVFGKMEDGSRVAVVVGDGRPAGRIVRQALVSLLAANASLVTVAVMTLLLNCRHIFYGLSFLETFHQMGHKKWYMIFSLTDETYSLLCSLKTPEGVDPNAMRFWIALLDHSYWIFGSVIGAVIGGVLPFDSTGIDFAMTALFTVIFVEQWMSAKCHIPAFLGLGAAAVSLAILGPDNFILPAMIAICVMLVAMHGRLAKEVAE